MLHVCVGGGAAVSSCQPLCGIQGMRGNPRSTPSQSPLPCVGGARACSPRWFILFSSLPPPTDARWAQSCQSARSWESWLSQGNLGTIWRGHSRLPWASRLCFETKTPRSEHRGRGRVQIRCPQAPRRLTAIPRTQQAEGCGGRQPGAGERNPSRACPHSRHSGAPGRVLGAPSPS